MDDTGQTPTVTSDDAPRPRFHLAMPVHDLAAARALLRRPARLPRGSQRRHWVDFDLYGHQIVAHLDRRRCTALAITNPVDGDDVPVPHFGVLLSPPTGTLLADRLRAAGTSS
jgi:uncharacterized protein